MLMLATFPEPDPKNQTVDTEEDPWWVHAFIVGLILIALAIVWLIPSMFTSTGKTSVIPFYLLERPQFAKELTYRCPQCGEWTDRLYTTHESQEIGCRRCVLAVMTKPLAKGASA